MYIMFNWGSFDYEREQETQLLKIAGNCFL